MLSISIKTKVVANLIASATDVATAINIDIAIAINIDIA